MGEETGAGGRVCDTGTWHGRGQGEDAGEMGRVEAWLLLGILLPEPDFSNEPTLKALCSSEFWAFSIRIHSPVSMLVNKNS